jgi:serine/threonine protein kinase
MPERQFGPYRLVRQIAVGGMAEIHLAKTKGLAGFEKYVALKMIHPNFAEDDQFIQMLVDEAKIAVQLTHGNIGQTFDLGRVGDTYYITMEYIDGADLYKLLRRSSEIELEMPLDVCAYVGKEVASALDYAHRKKDTFGKSLGIVHRDISPQNVLVSYAGEVKLVDFGIAKATSKAKQTAIGVIKGKYYYMSPEQAWGDPIDYRSDIFSAGIVLYEMLTGQMLYLEEDLHRLLDMARRADIAPPTTLRKGIPPQLERIVMHALSKVPGERYQSAGDLATDLERFLHAYSPVFTAAKLSTLLRQVLGDPLQIPDDDSYDLEVRSGPQQTHPLPAEAVLKADEREEIRDENSVIFRLEGLKGGEAKAAAAMAAAEAIAPGAVKDRAPDRGTAKQAALQKPAVKQPTGGVPVIRPVPRTTRPADPPLEAPIPKLAPAAAKSGPVKRPTGPTPIKPAAAPAKPAPKPAPAKPAPAKPAPAKPAPPPKSRGLDDNTRQMEAPLPPVDEPSGLLVFEQPSTDVAAPSGPSIIAAQRAAWADAAETQSIDEELENVGDRTVITKPTGSGGGGGGGGGDDDAEPVGRVEATMITAAPSRDTAEHTAADVGDIDAAIDAALLADAAADAGARAGDDDDDEQTLSPEDDGPTVQRDFRDGLPGPKTKRRVAAASVKTPPKAAPPPALAANIHSPAVSELRKPRPSRRTPPGGVSTPGASVLQAIVGSQASEPMPTPRPMPAPSAPPMQPPPMQPPMQPMQPPPMQPQQPMQPPMPFPTPQSMPQQPMPMPPQPPQGYDPMAPSPYASQPMAPFAYGTPGPSPYNAPVAIGMPTPPPGMPVYSMPGVPPHLQPYAQAPSGYSSQPMPAAPWGYPSAQGMMSPPAFPALSPGAMYGAQQPMGPSLTGQLRLSEGDELPAAYNLSGGRSWLKLAIGGLALVAVAATITLVVIRSHGEGPTTGSFRFVSTPLGAEIELDGQRLADKTPFTLDGVPVGTRHDVKITLSHYETDSKTVDLPRTGGEVEVTFALKPVVGKILVNCPAGTEVRIDGVLRQTGPGNITDVDLSAKKIELRAPGYQPFIRDLDWPANGVIAIDAHLQK